MKIMLLAEKQRFMDASRPAARIKRGSMMRFLVPCFALDDHKMPTIRSL
ncbi:hypothetical protein [Sphaerisporangium fuscum]|nr:hypothetical protein [Sphaerisporangium fuscum]